jgi:hypothetical protein
MGVSTTEPILGRVLVTPGADVVVPGVAAVVLGVDLRPAAVEVDDTVRIPAGVLTSTLEVGLVFTPNVIPVPDDAGVLVDLDSAVADL